MFLFVLIIFSFIFSKPAQAASTPYFTELNVASPQWVEIYNPGDTVVNLNGWQVANQSGTKATITNLEIGVTSYAVFTIDPTIFKVDESNYVELWNGSSSISRAPSYSPNTLSDRSWSRQSENSWCVASSSKGTQNNSCYVSATATPTPTLTPTITPTKATTPTITPKPTIEIAPTLEPTIIPEPTSISIPTVSDTQIANADTDVSSEVKPKKNNIGLIFIFIGGLLLLSPLLITKIQQWRTKSSKR